MAVWCLVADWGQTTTDLIASYTNEARLTSNMNLVFPSIQGDSLCALQTGWRLEVVDSCPKNEAMPVLGILSQGCWPTRALRSFWALQQKLWRQELFLQVTFIYFKVALQTDNSVLKIFFSKPLSFSFFLFFVFNFPVYIGYGNEDSHYSALYVLWVRETSKRWMTRRSVKWRY